MNTSNRSKQLLEGLAIGAIVIVTLIGAVLLSARNTIALPIASPTPIGPATSSATAAPINTPVPTINTPVPTIIAATVAPAVTQSATAIVTGTSTPTPTSCPPAIGWQPYTVGSFDTLFLIAQKFNVDPTMLTRANCLSNYTVNVGQTIYVPYTSPTATTAPCYPPYYWAIYIVRPGDTLSSLAVRYDTSVYQLQQANCLTTTFIYVGQMLRVPPIMIYPTATPTFMPSATPTNTPTPSFTPVPPTAVPPTAVPPTSVPTIGSSPTPTGTSTPTPTDKTVPPSPTPTDIPTTTSPSPTNTAISVPVPTITATTVITP